MVHWLWQFQSFTTSFRYARRRKQRKQTYPCEVVTIVERGRNSCDRIHDVLCRAGCVRVFGGDTSCNRLQKISTHPFLERVSLTLTKLPKHSSAVEQNPLLLLVNANKMIMRRFQKGGSIRQSSKTMTGFNFVKVGLKRGQMIGVQQDVIALKGFGPKPT